MPSLHRAALVVLRAARTRLEKNPRAWTKGAYARDRGGRGLPGGRVGLLQAQGVSFCITGLIVACGPADAPWPEYAGSEGSPTADALQALRRTMKVNDLLVWNDGLPDVIGVVKVVKALSRTIYVYEGWRRR